MTHLSFVVLCLPILEQSHTLLMNSFCNLDTCDENNDNCAESCNSHLEDMENDDDDDERNMPSMCNNANPAAMQTPMILRMNKHGLSMRRMSVKYPTGKGVGPRGKAPSGGEETWKLDRIHKLD